MAADVFDAGFAQSSSCEPQFWFTFSHSVPLKPYVQLHAKLLTRSMHVAPLRHGLLAHSFTSVAQLLPEYPAAHWQS